MSNVLIVTVIDLQNVLMNLQMVTFANIADLTITKYDNFHQKISRIQSFFSILKNKPVSKR